MRNNIKEIVPGEGLGDLKFGLSRDQVRMLLGDPDEIEQQEFEDDPALTEAWHYDELELSVSFDEYEDWRVVTIAVSSEHYQMAGNAIVGNSLKEVSAFLDEQGYGPIEVEDVSSENGTSNKLIAVVPLEMNFWFENDFLTEIQWGPMFNEDDSIDWPA